MSKRRWYTAMVMGALALCLGVGCGQTKSNPEQTTAGSTETKSDPLADFEDAIQQGESSNAGDENRNLGGIGVENGNGIEDYNITVSDGKASFTMFISDLGSEVDQEVGILVFVDGVPAMFTSGDEADVWMRTITLQPEERMEVPISLETPIPSAESKARIHVVAVKDPGYQTTKENIVYGNSGSIVSISYPLYMEDTCALEQPVELKQAEVGQKIEDDRLKSSEQTLRTSVNLAVEEDQLLEVVHGRQELSQLMVQASGLEKGTYYVSLWIDWKPVTAFAGQLVGEINVEDPNTQYLLRVDLPEDMDLDISDQSTISAIIVPEDGFTFARTTGSTPYWE